MSHGHVPVLLPEVLAALSPGEGEIIVDCTLGRGGHAEALLKQAPCRLVGLDRDPEAIAACRERLARFGDRFVAVHAPFSRLGPVLDELDISHVDGVLADLGVSSPQLDEARRGFSFRRAGPIDMRMDPSAPLSAADLVDDWSEDALASILRELGEERHARRIARLIVQGRPWKSTVELADAIKNASRGRPERIHPATRTFQALRLRVNDELGELHRLLEVLPARLSSCGRIAIISFHSLEDRIVKQFLARASGRTGPRDPWGHPVETPSLRSRSRITRPAPDDPNPRARSARMRTATRLPWDTSPAP